MKLRGQHEAAPTPRPGAESGYAMAALLIGLSVMAILMTAVMPVWRQDAQREKEAELIFRGQQYVHAIQMYQRRTGPGAYPPSFDFMVQNKFLRKRYKDPITNADFVPIPGVAAATVPGAPAGGAAGATTTIATPGTPTGTGVTGVPIGPTPSDGSAPGGVAGVMSRSTDKSIRIFNGQTHYNEWVFRALPQNAPGGGAAGANGPQRGGAQRGGNGQNQPPAFGNPTGGGINQPPFGGGGFGAGRGPQRGTPPPGQRGGGPGR